MDGEVVTWWIVFIALLVVLALPTGGRRPHSQTRRVG